MTSSTKPAVFPHKLKFILLPQLLVIPTHYTCSLPPLANVDWSLFPKYFLLYMLIHDWWNGANIYRALNWQWGTDIAPILVHISLGNVIEYWPVVGTCEHHGHSKLCYVCSPLLALALPSPTPLPCLSHPILPLCWSKINDFL